MKIKKEAQELKLYMFTVQRGPIKIDLPEDFRAVMAYNNVDALNMVRNDYTKDQQLFIKKRAQVEVQKIIDVVNPQIPKDLQVMSPKQKKKTKAKTKQDFINGMMLIADRFVTNKRDQTSLKRILNKIKINENKTNNKS